MLSQVHGGFVWPSTCTVFPSLSQFLWLALSHKPCLQANLFCTQKQVTILQVCILGAMHMTVIVMFMIVVKWIYCRASDHNGCCFSRFRSQSPPVEMIPTPYHTLSWLGPSCASRTHKNNFSRLGVDVEPGTQVTLKMMQSCLAIYSVMCWHKRY